jgi:peptidoglycan/LPS O-acetylase OafA/YrhL
MATSRVSSPSISSQPQETFAFIGALRGIAALLAAYFHSMMFGVHNLTMSEADLSIQSTIQVFGIPFGYLDFGKIGIAIFFIVSGFLIPYTLTKPGATISQFVIKRVFRLYPAYWVSIAILWVAKLIFDVYPEVTLPNTIVNLTMFQKFIGVSDINGVFWTLQIELIFYVICGMLFLTRQLHRRKEMLYLSLMAALVCATLRYYTGRNLPVALFLALTLMWWGDLLRHSIKEPAAHSKAALYSAVIILLLLGPICWLAYKDLSVRYFLSYVAAILVFSLALPAKKWMDRPTLFNRVLNTEQNLFSS